MQTNTNQMVLAALVLGVLVHPLAAAAGIRAAYGEGAAKTWDEAQSQCQAWGGSLVKAEGALASRLAKIKCTDVLWVGAHEAPKTRGSDRARWRWISDASSVAASVWHDGEPNNYEGVEEECGFVGTYTSWMEDLKVFDGPCDARIPFACEIPGLELDEMVLLSEKSPQTSAATMAQMAVCGPRHHAGLGESLGAMSNEFREQDVVIAVRTSIPLEPGCLFEAGGTGSGTFVGVVQKGSGVALRLTAGEGSVVGSIADDDTAVLTIPLPDPRLPQDGSLHELLMKVDVKAHSITLAVDGAIVASASTLSTASHRITKVLWSGGDEACVGRGCSTIAAGGVFDQWQGKLETDLFLWQASADILSFAGSARNPQLHQQCFFTELCSDGDGDGKGLSSLSEEEAFLIFIWFGAAFLALSLISTVFVVWYCCCHDTKSRKCCPFRKASGPACQGGAFCTPHANLTALSDASDSSPQTMVRIHCPASSTEGVNSMAEGAGRTVGADAAGGGGGWEGEDGAGGDNVKYGKESKERLDTSALDGLRGLAALHVAVGHYCGFSDLHQDLSGGQAKFSEVSALVW